MLLPAERSMWMAAVTIAIVVATTLLGLVSSYILLWAGRPRSLALQRARRDVRTLHAHLPLIFVNVTILGLGAAAAIIACGDRLTLTAPPVYVMGLQVFVILLVEDFWFYWEHRLLHANQFFYRTVHRIHHRAAAPLPIEYIYAHPLEWMVGGIGPAIAMVALGAAHGQMSAWTLWTYAVVRQLHELNIHSGLRALIAQRVPWLGTADRHDLHHARPTSGNYGSIFHLWDRAFGTEAGVPAHQRIVVDPMSLATVRRRPAAA